MKELLGWFDRRVGRGFVPGALAVAMGWSLHYLMLVNAPIQYPTPIPVQARPPVATHAEAIGFPLLDSLASDSGFVALVDLTARREGWRARPYTDSEGNITVGFGWNISAGVSEQLGKVVETYQLAKAWDDLRATWPPFTTMPPPVQWALTAAAYQLGVHGLEGFRRMLADLEAGNASGAVLEIRQSRWYEQTPARAEDLIAAIREHL